MDPELGARYPLQSLKLHAELAGIGRAQPCRRHPAASRSTATCTTRRAFTELALPPDKPLAEIPARRRVASTCFGSRGPHPVHEVLPGSVPIRARSTPPANKPRCTTTWPPCAELTQQFETVPQVLREAIATDDPEEREALLLGRAQQGAVVPDVRREWRPVSAMFRMHAGLSDRDQCTARRSAETRRRATRRAVAKGAE